MTNDGALIFGIGILVLGLILLAVMILMTKIQKNRQQHLKSKGHTSQVTFVYLLIYKKLSRFWLTKHAIYNIRSRMEMVGHLNERVIRKKVVQIYGLILSLIGVMFLVILRMTHQLIVIALLLIMLWFLAETVIDYFVVRLKNRLLFQQIKFNDLLRHKYYESNMVDEAVYEACQALEKDAHEIGIQGERIYDVLTSKDIEKEMIGYNETAPNKFLKMLLGLAYITMEYGDTFIEGQSVFLKNMNDLTNEIRIELSKREKLNYALKSLNIIVLTPLFFITPVKNWASSYFMPLKIFYESQTGFIIEILTMMMIFFAYMLLRRIQQFDDQKIAAYKKHTFEKKLYEKGLYKLVDFMKPTNKKGRYFKLKRLLKECASPLDVEGFITRKCMYFLVGFLLAIALMSVLHMNARTHILNAPTIPEYFIGGQLSQEELLKAEAITAQDKTYLSQLDTQADMDEIIMKLETDGIPINESQIIAERLMKKQVILLGQYLKWWEMVIGLLWGMVGYQIPNLFLAFQKKIAKIDIEDEVTGFSSIILMLMNHERLSVMDLLEWLELFSFTFKEPLQDCLNNCSSGITEALHGLREVSVDPRFVKLMDSLILATQDITIGQAFDELESEKGFYLEERKQSNERIIEKKVNLGRMIGFVPLYGFILMYMIIPMIVTSMADMEAYLNQMAL